MPAYAAADAAAVWPSRGGRPTTMRLTVWPIRAYSLT
jgi:hypothetical protein